MEERISVDKEILREVYDDLNSRGFSLSQISENIDSDFRNHLYKQSTFTKHSFRKLKSIYGEDIPFSKVDYIDGSGAVEKLELDKNKEMAELVGMILGDGHIDKHSYNRGDRYISSYYLCLTLASCENRIIKRAKFLGRECLGREFNEEELSNADAVNLKMYGKLVVKALNEVGLVSGNKVQKQVYAPEWIYRNREFQKACLRGLFDTDGSYYERSEDGYKIAYFKNMSDNLLDDFVELCSNLDISASKAGKNAVQVAAQGEVEKFVSKVKPIKAKNQD